MEVLRTGITQPRASFKALLNNVENECKHSYDFLRELISNSYDAKCTRIDVFPHYVMSRTAEPICSVLVVMDDGRGMDDLPLENADGLLDAPRSRLDACFQLGMSTNTGVDSCGRFCYGTQQVMLKCDVGFVCITRTARMPPDEVILIDSDHIRDDLLGNEIEWKVVTRDTAFQVPKPARSWAFGTKLSPSCRAYKMSRRRRSSSVFGFTTPAMTSLFRKYRSSFDRLSDGKAKNSRRPPVDIGPINIWNSFRSAPSFEKHSASLFKYPSTKARTPGLLVTNA